MVLKPERIKLGKGIYLNIIKTEKFKSSLVSFYFTRPLRRREVTLNALLALVLRRGSKSYPNSLNMEKELEENYGANLSVGVNKKGEKQVVRYTIEWYPGKYFKDKDYNYRLIKILKELIYNPYLEDRVFKEEYVEEEKERLKRIIQERVNDKRAYAIDRCIEEMCKNERFSLYELGYIEDLQDIDSKTLYSHYQSFLEESPIEIFYLGAYDPSLVNYLKEENKIERSNIISIPEDVIISSGQTKNLVKESLDVSQGELVVGYRTGIGLKDQLYNGLLMASSILGRGPNSQLFKSIKEREALASYINSSILKYKSILLVNGGIGLNNFEKTLDIIREEIEGLKAGEFTEKDRDLASQSLKSSIESIKDSIFLTSEYFFSQTLSGDRRSIGERVKEIEKVDREDIIEAANKICIDTIYFIGKKDK